MDGRIFKAQIRSIQENGVILFAHGNSELIHNSAVDAVEIVLGILSDKRQILIGHVKAKHIPENKSGQYLNGCGGRQAGAVGNVAEQKQIHSIRDLKASLFKRPHNSLGIIGPVSFLLRL